MNYEEYDSYEPTEIEGLSRAIKMEANVSIDAIFIRNSISDYVDTHLKTKLMQMIQEEVIKCLKSSYDSKASFERLLKEIMIEKFNERYPDVVENKINELEKQLKEYKVDWGKDHAYSYDKNTVQTIKEAAKIRVEKYINGELSESVKLSKEYIEQFAKNYFANNLFRAMGMMDKMLPQTENNVLK